MSFLRTSVPAFSSASPAVTPQYTGLQLQTSSSALPIPILYGTNRLAPNLIWNGDFRTHTHYSYESAPSGGKGGGGSSMQSMQVSGYTYTTALLFGLCEGPATSLGTVFRNQSATTTSSDNLSLLTGSTPQAPWSFLSTKYPAQALGYQGTALAASSLFHLRSSASIGTLSIEVSGLLAGSSSVNAFDADPALAIQDLLVNPQFGVGFPSASLDATSLLGASGDASYQTYCKALGLALSPCLTDQEAASSILARWLQLTNSTAIWSAGRLKILTYGDDVATRGGTTFQPITTPVYDLADDDFIAEPDGDPVIVTRADPYAAANVQTLEIVDRANQYAATPIEARDQNAIEQTGPRAASVITAHEICASGIGAVAAQLILQRGLYVRNTYAFRLSWDYCLLEPMDLVTLTDAGLGLSRTPVRIVAISEDADGLLSVTAEEYPGQIGTTAGYPVVGAAGSGIDRGIAPASVNPPVIFEPPSDLTGGTPQLWIGLSGGASGIADPNWGGALVYASTDNASYTEVGGVTGAARQGVLAAPLGALPGAPFDTLSVDVSESGATLTPGATPTLLVVDGEIISFTTATLTGTSIYSLGGLKRAVYGQRGLAHAAGAQALVLDSAVFTYALPAAVIGRKLWLKFASVNAFGTATQDLSTCTAYVVTPVGSGYFGPVSQAIATGTSLDEGLASGLATETDDDGLASDPYSEPLDMGLASEAATALAVQSGGTGATTGGGARQNIGAASSGANTDITSLSGLTTPLAVGQGGTGASTVPGARAALGAAASGANSDITSLTNLAALGIGTSADTVTNLFAMKSANALFDNAGAGVAVTVNKAASGASAYHQFSTGYSTRAQVGLLASERWRVSVSSSGSSFAQALDVDPATGHVGLSGYTADANNALGVLGSACLFAAATDSMRFTFSKVAAANDATLSFQTAFSTRALLGTTGSDAFQLKLSPDGSTFYQVFVCDQTTGNAAFKALVGLATYTVAAMPAAFNGALAFASNGRKAGEAAGAGTGVLACFSNGSWRRLSDDAAVTA